jgi:hypothetical protein
MFSNLIHITYLIFIIIFQNINYYLRSIEKLVKGHLEIAVIDLYKLNAPFIPIELSL